MFDIGWLELLVIGMVALIVVGPKDLPGMFRTVGQFVGKARGMAREFQRSMEAAADESGFKEAADGMKDAADGMKGLDALGQAQSSMKDYAKNYVTQKDQKSAGEALVDEASKIASPAAKATAPVKETSKPAPKKAAPKKSPVKKPATSKAKSTKAASTKADAQKKPASKKPAKASNNAAAKS